MRTSSPRARACSGMSCQSRRRELRKVASRRRSHRRSEPAMIVCLCRSLSEAALCALIEAGASTPRKVVEACGAGIDCGACGAMVKELIKRAEGTAIRAASPST